MPPWEFPDGTCQRDNTGADEGKHDQADDGTALQCGRRRCAGEHASEGFRRVLPQEALEGAAGELLECRFQLVHAEQEQAEARGDAPEIEFRSH